jgi:hypothetical protein
MCSTNSGSTSVNLLPGQGALLNQQQQFTGNTLIPTYGNALSNLNSLYSSSAGGQLNAAQNLAGTANQAQNVLGSTGQSALNTGVTGLESLFSPGYEQQQINAAMAPAEYQYQQNLANQGAQFGGAGELGSARQALAGQQLASTNAMNQATLAANISQGIAGQRQQVGSQLANIGQSGLTGAIGAANTQLAASQSPLSFFNSQYLSQLGNAPGYTIPNYNGTQGTSNNSSSFNWGNILGNLGL